MLCTVKKNKRKEIFCFHLVCCWRKSAIEHSGEMGKELTLDEDNQSKSSLELDRLL